MNRPIHIRAIQKAQNRDKQSNKQTNIDHDNAVGLHKVSCRFDKSKITLCRTCLHNQNEIVQEYLEVEAELTETNS